MQPFSIDLIKLTSSQLGRPGARPRATAPTSGPSFTEMLQNSLQQVERLNKESEASMKKLAVGDNTNVHETMLAIEKADLSFRLLLQVRNKIMGAYQEIMRLQI